MAKKQMDIEDYTDKNTGQVIPKGQLNEVIWQHTKRPDGTLRIQFDYSNCPTMTEQHSAHVTDLNYLIAKFKPDELAAYIAARTAHRQEIIGHDFANEPTLQDARNITYNLKKSFDALPEEIKNNFKNHVEFLKFIDNPENQEKMVKLGLMTKKEILKHTDPKLNDEPNDDKTKSSLPSPNPEPKK